MKHQDILEIAQLIRDGKASPIDTIQFLKSLRFELAEISEILNEPQRK
jgi:hypothetical protein